MKQRREIKGMINPVSGLMLGKWDASLRGYLGAAITKVIANLNDRMTTRWNLNAFVNPGLNGADLGFIAPEGSECAMQLSVKRLARFLDDEKGATAIEYALLASGIFLVILTGVLLLGSQVHDLYQSVADGMATVPPSP
jgi:pilus assembly protein Flp/PilA